MGDVFRVNFYRSNVKTGIENAEVVAETDIEMQILTQKIE